MKVVQDGRPELTQEWLREQLVTLLAAAQTADPPDYAACAKFADLLYKMLPRGESRSVMDDVIKQAQDAIRASRVARAATLEP